MARSPLDWAVLPFALGSAGVANLLQWYCNAFDYSLNVGGRPPHSAPAFTPITFDMSVLTAAVVGMIAYFALTGLPEL